MLDREGFRPLSERDVWTLSPGDRHYVTRNDSSIVAFVVGDQPPAEAGFCIVGAHTDAPCLKVKPAPDLVRCGFRQLAVECYGGLLLSTWLDRDLGLAGRVVVARPDGQVQSLLVEFDGPIARIPSLAVHLDREVNTRGLVLNQQQHMVPVLGLDRGEANPSVALKGMLAGQIGAAHGTSVAASDILDFDLMLYDTQPAAIGGSDRAFVFAPRLDNLASCHAATAALLESVGDRHAAAWTRAVTFWDNEECGSRSAQGAQGPLICQVLARIVETRSAGAAQAMPRALASSFLISADMAHAVHPNYADRYEPNHLPVIGMGPVIKSNANQSYASDGVSSARFVAMCRAAGFEPQRFVMRSDLPCGSTIGPITAALTGIKAVDVGNPLLSMHSIREMAGVEDHARMTAVMKVFFDRSPSPTAA